MPLIRIVDKFCGSDRHPHGPRLARPGSVERSEIERGPSLMGTAKMLRLIALNCCFETDHLAENLFRKIVFSLTETFVYPKILTPAPMFEELSIFAFHHCRAVFNQCNRTVA